VPQAEREEFINVGVIVCARTPEFLAAEFVLDTARLQAFTSSVEMDEIRGHLDSIKQICAGGEAAGALGRMSRRERFGWSRRAARSSKLPPFTPASAKTRKTL
jgi:hypothetical protein